tara:strand:+ start:101 stop:235 length:135 start_codon:yes stop_codon:yes gene_type:complete
MNKLAEAWIPPVFSKRSILSPRKKEIINNPLLEMEVGRYKRKSK